MKKVMVIGFCCYILLCPLFLGAQVVSKDLKIIDEKLAEGLYKLDIQSAFPVTVLLFKGEDGNLLVDTGFPFTAEALQKKLIVMGADKISFLINTHEHQDHTGGNTIVDDDTTIIAHAMVKKQLVEGANIFRFLPDKALPDKVLTTETQELEFNGQKVTLIPLTGGHSDSDLVVYFPQSKVVYTGGLTNAKLFPYVDVGKSGSALNYPQIIGKLIHQVPEDVIFVPGHGANFTMKDLKEFHQMLEKSIAVVVTALKSGKDSDTIVKEGLLREWDSYGKGFVTPALWVKQIDAGLNPKPIKKSLYDPLFEKLHNTSVSGFLSLYNELKKNHGDEFEFNEAILNNFGYYLLNTKKQIDDAIEIFKVNVAEYPDAFNVYDSLGEGYMIKGNKEEAIKNYKKALSINPDFENAQKMLQKLEGSSSD